MFFSNVIF